MPSRHLPSSDELWAFTMNYVKTRTWSLTDDDIDFLNDYSKNRAAEREEQENAEV